MGSFQDRMQFLNALDDIEADEIRANLFNNSERMKLLSSRAYNDAIAALAA